MSDCNEILDHAGSEAERVAHVANCASCRLERKWREDFAELPRTAGDSALERRIVDRVLGVSRTAPAPRPSRARFVALAFAAVLLIGLAFASQLGTKTEPRSEPTASPTLTPAPTPPPTATAKPRATAAEREAKPASPAPVVSAPVPKSDDLFTRANQARRAGNVDQALSLYRDLQRLHPKSREAHTSRALVGRLLLDRGDAKSALPEFDAYLAAGGTLGEEALAGRALALERLGRRAEEREAWQKLLEQHPGTLHRTHAETRLED
jgi:hypothetical protein